MMTIQERLDEIEALALRHYPTPFEANARLAFRLAKVEQIVREYDFREKALCRLEVRE